MRGEFHDSRSKLMSGNFTNFDHKKLRMIRFVQQNRKLIHNPESARKRNVFTQYTLILAWKSVIIITKPIVTILPMANSQDLGRLKIFFRMTICTSAGCKKQLMFTSVMCSGVADVLHASWEADNDGGLAFLWRETTLWGVCKSNKQNQPVNSYSPGGTLNQLYLYQISLAVPNAYALPSIREIVSAVILWNLGSVFFRWFNRLQNIAKERC